MTEELIQWKSLSHSYESMTQMATSSIDSVKAKTARPRAARASKTDDSRNAREKLIRAAEVQFLRQGFSAVSIRTIAESAGVNSALITYHFGSKEGLFRLVFANAIAPLNQQRMQSFAELELTGKYTVKQVLHAWIRPVFNSRFLVGSTPNVALSFSLGEDYAELKSQLASEIYDEVNEKFLSLIEKLIPKLSRATLVYRLLFLIGAVMTATRDRSKSLRKLSRGQHDSTDLESLVTQLVTYSAAGFQTPEV